MDPLTATAWVELVKSLGLGLTVSALLVLWALYNGKLHWGWYTRGVERERDEWKHAALSGTGVLEKLVERIEARRL